MPDSVGTVASMECAEAGIVGYVPRDASVHQLQLTRPKQDVLRLPESGPTNQEVARCAGPP